MENLKIYPKAEEFLSKLEAFSIVQKGHFEYKKLFEDGKRAHGGYYINYRILTTAQELELVPYYADAIENWLGQKNNLLIVGVAMASLALPKAIQLHLYRKTNIEYAYTEKREGILGIYGEQAEKCRGKHLLFIEDVCNNATSSRELINEIERKQSDLGITGYSILYGVHRGNAYLSEPKGEIYAMSHVKAPSYHPNECPVCKSGIIPLKEYKKG